MSSPQVVVVGGGVFGVSAALSLRQRGYAVTLLDRLPLPAEDAATTDISKVVRADYADGHLYQRLALASMRVFRERWNADAERRLGRALYIQCGCLFATRAGDMSAFERQSMEALARDGVLVQRVGPSEVAEWMGPAFAHEFPYGYFNKTAGYAFSGLTLEYMVLLAKEAGVDFITGPAAGAFAEYIKDGSKVVGVKTVDGTHHRADRVLVAAGSWTPSLVPQLQGLCSPSAQPVVHFAIKDEKLKQRLQSDRFPVFFADVSDTGIYGFPLNPTTGEVKIAHHGVGFSSSFHEDGRKDPAKTTPTVIPKGALNSFRSFVAKAFPELNRLDITRTRVCWYCESWDGNFFIDAVPEIEGLFVATGGSGHGFKFAPVLGDVIADIMEGRATEYRDLFKWRVPPKGAKVELDAIRKRTNDESRVLEEQELCTAKDLLAWSDARL
ncbi:FAD dependent oxidoreductase [Chytriomyces sp. MP71]|nr:FAD dependent oxidoreductase [Chytriomyces sp. MP71]